MAMAFLWTAAQHLAQAEIYRQRAAAETAPGNQRLLLARAANHELLARMVERRTAAHAATTEMLTPAEIQQLRDERREAAALAAKWWDHLRPKAASTEAAAPRQEFP